MLLKSIRTGKAYDVNIRTNADGSKGVCHESLQDILENHLEEAEYSVDVLSASSSYSAAACMIKNPATGRMVQGFGDVVTAACNDRGSKEQNAFASIHPMTAAVQDAIDMAVLAYLQWPERIDPTDVLS